MSTLSDDFRLCGTPCQAAQDIDPHTDSLCSSLDISLRLSFLELSSILPPMAGDLSSGLVHVRLSCSSSSVYVSQRRKHLGTDKLSGLPMVISPKPL